jgi:sugar phosphate isomerase/epimerase
MSLRDGIKHPLSAPVKSGLETLESLGLLAESSMRDDIRVLDDYAEVLISAHAPATAPDGTRLNIAATDDDFRGMSIGIITKFIDEAGRYPKVKQVNIHFAPRQWIDDAQTAGQEGDYDLLIDGVRRIAAYADRQDIEIVMENGNAYWKDLDESVEPEEVDWTTRNRYFGSAPEHWIEVCQDVDRDNVGLCLDSSHTCTYAQTFPESQREERVLAFLKRPELIRHVHWSDNYLHDKRGRNDSHLSVGKGTLPTEMHRRIKRLDATILLEHFYTVEELKEELEYIDSL